MYGGLSSEDRIPRASAEANRPFILAPTKMSSGRFRWALDCRRPSFGKIVFSDRVDQGKSSSRRSASIGAQARSCGGGRLRRSRSKKPLTRSPAGATPATDGERVYVYFGSYGLVCYDLDGNLKWERRLPLPENPYGAVLHLLSRENCWCSTIRAKTPTCLASIAATAEPSGKRTVRCFSMDGRLRCIGVTTASTRLSCSEVTSSRTSV